MLRKFLGALAALILVAAPAGAQQSAQKATYRFAGANVSTFAASPTDWLVISGASNKAAIKVRRISLCGTASTPTSIDVLLIKRTGNDTGGTQSSATGGAMDNSRPSPTPLGTVQIYTANPTLGAITSGGGNFDAKKLNLSTAGAAGCLFWEFGSAETEPPVLRAQLQQLAVNFNGVSLPTGTSLTWTVETTEEP